MALHHRNVGNSHGGPECNPRTSFLGEVSVRNSSRFVCIDFFDISKGLRVMNTKLDHQVPRMLDGIPPLLGKESWLNTFDISNPQTHSLLPTNVRVVLKQVIDGCGSPRK